MTCLLVTMRVSQSPPPASRLDRGRTRTHTLMVFLCFFFLLLFLFRPPPALLLARMTMGLVAADGDLERAADAVR